MYEIDHIVLCFQDLDEISQRFESLGFKLTPEAQHPWGTKNRLIQLNDHTFIELLSVENEELIKEGTSEEFSFGAFNRDFLRDDREGGSMIALKGTGKSDVKRFKKHRLKNYKPFKFERSADLPDGESKKVAFELAFTECKHLKGIGFFSCLQLFPQNFWVDSFQKHPNSAMNLHKIVLVAENPGECIDFFTRFAYVPVSLSGSGVSVFLSNCYLEVMEPEDFTEEYGIESKPVSEGCAYVGAIFVSVRDFKWFSENSDGKFSVPENSEGQMRIDSFPGETALIIVQDSDDPI